MSDEGRSSADIFLVLWATVDRIGVRYLLTEDFQDGRTLGGVTFVNPFKSENTGLLAEILPTR